MLRPGPIGRKLTVTARAGVNPVDRIIGGAVYLLPFIDAWNCGRFLFAEVPKLKSVFQPLFGLISSYHSSGYLPVVVFFALYIGVIQNRSMFSGFVRFNAMQALLLDVLLVLPRLLESVVSPPAFGWGHTLYEYSQTLIWVFMAFWSIYAAITCFTGTSQRIPFVAQSADAQV